MNDWSLSVQNKKCDTVAYIDFRRAFDSVSHKKLFTRLYEYGIQGDILRISLLVVHTIQELV